MTAPSKPKLLQAVQQVKRMRGGSQSHLMLASDGSLQVCKFQNNPQSVRVLANEFMANRLGRLIELPMPEVAILEVPDWLVKSTPDLRMQVAGVEQPCSIGLQLACRYLADPEQDVIFDYLPESLMLQHKRIVEQFAKVLVFDRWTGNTDGRQAVFTKQKNSRKYRTTFIDQGFCFNSANWDFPDHALVGVYHRNSVYEHVIGWESFEPVLTRAETIDPDQLWSITEDCPEEWYGGDWLGLERLIETLYQRRRLIRDLITDFRYSSRQPFPNWADN